MIKTISVIGHGYVGKSVSQYFSPKYNIKVYDKAVNPQDKEWASDCDLAVVCVPTPSNKDGSVDLSAIHDVMGWLTAPLIVIKSTVPPGTTDYLKSTYSKRIVFSPEYIGEGGFPVGENDPHPTDMIGHRFMIFGGDKADTKEVIQYFKAVSGPQTRYLQTDSKTAELVKYMTNCYLASKVAFTAEFSNIASYYGIDFDELRELWLQDARVGRSHTQVNFDNPGFGGKCLPKDLAGMINHADIPLPVLNAVHHYSLIK
jgi:UDPglucose 6-dehydrogenase